VELTVYTGTKPCVDRPKDMEKFAGYLTKRAVKSGRNWKKR
jgi:hypothetical protein